jgi:hypothetical protein
MVNNSTNINLAKLQISAIMAKLEIYLTDYMILGIYSPTCIKRSPFKRSKSGILRQGDIKKKFNSYEIFYDRTRKR